MTKPRISVSFSGGRTSAYMARWLQVNKSDEYDLQYIFANTGQEHEKTLEFVGRCDREWGLGVIWLEAKVNPEHGKGTRYSIVTFDTASRNGEPFEAVIAKYGIPNQAAPNKCTRETKGNPLDFYRKENGWGEALIAIGIRADEIDRVNPKYKELGLVYPLVSMHPVNKEQVIEWWADQPFDLEIPEHYGNCVWCWKKTLRKHLTTLNENPHFYDFPERMEKKYATAGALGKSGPQTFFRNNMSTKDLKELAKQPFEPFKEGSVQRGLFPLDPLDVTSGCEESCEVY